MASGLRNCKADSYCLLDNYSLGRSSELGGDLVGPDFWLDCPDKETGYHTLRAGKVLTSPL